MNRGKTSKLTRRAFAACALCAAGGFWASEVDAQNAVAPSLKRTPLRQTDGPVDGYTTIEMRIEIAAEAPIPRHTHPGVESGYVLEGGTDLAIDGVGALTLRPGDSYQVPTGRPHGGKNGLAKTVIIATYVVEKSKPLASPA